MANNAIVHHSRTCVTYQDDGPAFGFCGRAAYAMGQDRPHYLVPAILECTSENWARFSLAQWFSNHDRFWHESESHGRTIRNFS